MEKIIKAYAEKNNLIYGICEADKIQLAYSLSDYDVPFVEKDHEKRTNPKLILKDARSIIVLGMPYYKEDAFSMDSKVRAVFSIGAVGEDYHVSLKRHLKKIGEILQRNIQTEISYKYFADTGPLVERALAEKAGLGFFGRNFMLINKEIGSFFYIGYMVTDLPLRKSAVEHKKGAELCRNCSLCIKNCPGKALGEKFNYQRCVSYLTQKKERLTPKEMAIIGNSIYGCDICQKVCPYNKGKSEAEINDINLRMPVIEEFVNLTGKEFKEKYGNTAAFWRGKNILIRNALIAAGNVGNKEAEKFIKYFLSHSSEAVKEGAKYAHGMLVSKEHDSEG